MDQNQPLSNNSQGGRLFGFSYQQPDLDEIASKISPVPPNADDGVTVAAGGLTGYNVDMGGGSQRDAEAIKNYRCMALHPEVFPQFPAVALYVRLLFQPLFILWVWSSAIRDQS